MATNRSRFKPRQRLGKYRILRRLASGGFAEVFLAVDTVEGIQVALKVPHDSFIDDSTLEVFRKEVRLAARLDHPSILPIKNAGFVDDLFVIAYPLGTGTLADRLQRRLAVKTALSYADQLLAALACAHGHKIVHCDVKPDNLILFPGDRLRLTDFGIARVQARTMTGSGSGTVGYLAPEQAMGRPTLRSDVFSAGLVLYRLFAGTLPEWPFEWPMRGNERLRQRFHPDFIAILRRALEVDQRRRFGSAVEMHRAFLRVRPRALRGTSRRRRVTGEGTSPSWRTLRFGQCRREFGKALELRLTCRRCEGPVSEFMTFCPWCAEERKPRLDPTAFPARCPRCSRGVKLDWQYCPSCYGPRLDGARDRAYSDVRYCAHCRHCRGDLMPFMRYCPWCRRKVTRSWKIEGARGQCPRCSWGVIPEYWECCPWCSRTLRREGRR